MDIIELGTLDNTPVSQTDDVSFDVNAIQNGVIANDFTDVYNFSLANPTSLTVSIDANISEEEPYGASFLVIEKLDDTTDNGVTIGVGYSDLESIPDAQQTYQADLAPGDYAIFVSGVPETEDVNDLVFDVDYTLNITPTPLDADAPVDNVDNGDTIVTDPPESTGDNSTINTGTIETNLAVVNSYEGGGEPDAYQFTIAQAGTYEVELGDLEANLDLTIEDSEGNVVYSSTAPGTESELINAEFESSSYTAYIFGGDDVSSSYSFTISQTSTGDDSDDDSEPILNQGDTVYRFLETEAQTQFYTTSTQERDVVIDTLPNYTYEGESFIGAPNPDETDISGVIPVYRFFNTSTGVHLYTASEVERDSVRDNLPNYEFEGISYYGYETEVDGSVPLYRFYNQDLDAHFYTPSTAERDEFLDDSAYTLEGESGIAYYVNPVGEI